MFNTAKSLQAKLTGHPCLQGIGHAPATRRFCLVTLPAYNNGMCAWRATNAVAVLGLVVANAPLGGYRLFTNAGLAAEYMVTP